LLTTPPGSKAADGVRLLQPLRVDHRFTPARARS
jgi:hypothetical protein